MRPTINIRAGAPPAPDPLGLTGQLGLTLSGGSAPPVAIAALRLHRSLAWPVGQGEVILSPTVEPPEVGTGLQISGSSGGGSERPLFTGRLLRRQAGAWGTRLLVEEATGPLARLHIDKAVRKSTAARLIEEVCREAGVEAVVESPGATLPAYALHFGPSGLDHIIRLATMSGLLARTDVEGRLRLGVAPTAVKATLKREDGVIEFQTEVQSEGAADLRITGDGAMGSKGSGAESWLLQSLDSIAAGQGRSRHLPGLKAAADVSNAARALAMRRRESSIQHRLLLAGLPPADLGEVIRLSGMGEGAETARLVGITVVWDEQNGLVSRLELHGIGV